MTMIIVGVLILILAIAIWMFATHLLGNNQEIGLLFIIFALVFSAASVALFIGGTQQDTSETVLQHLATKKVVELQIGKDNTPYYALKDSTYKELYQYLTTITK